MARNHDFLLCIGERKNESFFKVLQGANLSSENMRAIPHDFVRSFSDSELSRKMKIGAQWGSSWEIKISKNSRFYFMEKSGWDKFVRNNALGDDEFLTFTHKGKMRFTVNIFNQDGKEMLQCRPQQSAAFSAYSRVKTEQGEGSYKNDKNEEVLSSDLSYLGSNRRGTYKRNLSFEMNKAKDSQNSKMTKKVNRVGRDSAGASSSSVAEFSVLIKRSYLNSLAIPKSAANNHLPEVTTMLKIHHPDDMDDSWDVVYLKKSARAHFSGGWKGLVKEYPIAIGDTCKFTVIKPGELVLVVSKAGEETH